MLTPQEQTNGLYIDPIFDTDQRRCWSADKYSSGFAWIVSFYNGYVDWSDPLLYGDLYVRGVRS